MTTTTIRRNTLMLAALLVTTATSLFFNHGASAEGDDCIDQCRSDASNCRFIAKETERACMEDAGCDILREEFRALCFSEDRDETVCEFLREDLRECAAPCLHAMRHDVETCRLAARDCLEGVCGIEVDPGERPECRTGGRRGLDR
jgi:hypothetical protein